MTERVIWDHEAAGLSPAYSTSLMGRTKDEGGIGVIEVKIEGGRVKFRCRGNQKEVASDLIGICQAVISGCSTESQSAAQQMKQDLCMAFICDMVSVENRDGSEIIVIRSGSEREEICNYRAVADMARRARRENTRLREQLGQQTEARREFDRQDQEDFFLVRFNRARLQGR